MPCCDILTGQAIPHSRRGMRCGQRHPGWCRSCHAEQRECYGQVPGKTEYQIGFEVQMTIQPLQITLISLRLDFGFYYLSVHSRYFLGILKMFGLEPKEGCTLHLHYSQSPGVVASLIPADAFPDRNIYIYIEFPFCSQAASPRISRGRCPSIPKSLIFNLLVVNFG